MGWEICWVTCFYLYSRNIRIQKDKFSQQCFQELCQTLVCIYIYIYIYIYLVIHNGLKVLVLPISFQFSNNYLSQWSPLPCLFEKFSISYHIARQHAPLLHNKTLISLFCTMPILFIFVVRHPG